MVLGSDAATAEAGAIPAEEEALLVRVQQSLAERAAEGPGAITSTTRSWWPCATRSARPAWRTCRR